MWHAMAKHWAFLIWDWATAEEPQIAQSNEKKRGLHVMHIMVLYTNCIKMLCFIRWRTSNDIAKLSFLDLVGAQDADWFKSE